MNPPPRLIHRRFIIAFALLIAPCISASMAAAAAPPTAAAKVREPAVAGLFYPKNPSELTRVIDAYLAGASTAPFKGELKALICPHAGYPFSGPVAGSAYRLLVGLHFDTVVVLGPSHYAALQAASVTNASAFRTPLGEVPISAKSSLLAQTTPFALEPRCVVQRPEWWPHSSREAPAVDVHIVTQECR